MMSKEIVRVLLEKSLSVIKEGATGTKIRRKDVHKILNRKIHIDKDLSKKIIKELEARGLIEHDRLQIHIKDKKRRLI